jgi:adenylate cyclase
MEEHSGADIVQFSSFRFDRRRGCLLRRNGDGALTPVAIGSRALDILGLLIDRHGDVVSKDEILNIVWPGVVEGANVTVQISALRRVLEDGRIDGSLIQTIPGRGYRFVAPVTRCEAEPLPRAGTDITPLVAPRLSIFVLPFLNLSNDPDQEYFADGLTDDLTSDLSRISGSFVIARTSAFTYKGKPIDVKHIGRELGVRYVLEGSVRRTGDQVRVDAQLIDAESAAQLCADRFDTNRANLALAQSEITGCLAWTLNIALLSDAGRRIEPENLVDPDARDLVMRGWAWWYGPQSPKAGQEALHAFKRALQIDPRSAGARIGIARVLAGSIANGWSSSSFQQDVLQRDVARAERLLSKAIESDPNQPMAYAVLGFLRRMQARLTESRLAFETAIALDPNLEWAHMQFGWTMLFLGEPGDARALGEKSLRLSPRDPNIFWRYELLGACELVSNQVDKAIDLFTKARIAKPRSWLLSFELAAALGLKGDLDAARAALAESLKLKPEINSFAQWYAYVPWASKERSPRFWALQDKTFSEGLRRIGFPEK